MHLCGYRPSVYLIFDADVYYGLRWVKRLSETSNGKMKCVLGSTVAAGQDLQYSKL